MNNLLLRKIDITDAFQPLGGDEVFTVDISTPPTNSAAVTFRVDGNEVDWVPGEYHTFHRARLGDIEVKGTAGDTVTLVGGTW